MRVMIDVRGDGGVEEGPHVALGARLQCEVLKWSLKKQSGVRRGRARSGALLRVLRCSSGANEATRWLFVSEGGGGAGEVGCCGTHGGAALHTSQAPPELLTQHER